MISHKEYFKYYASKKQRELRHKVDWDLASEYEAKGVDPKARMVDIFARLCEEEKPFIMPEDYEYEDNPYMP